MLYYYCKSDNFYQVSVLSAEQMHILNALTDNMENFTLSMVSFAV